MATSLYVPGREQDGNARIAPLILRLLQENQQNIPDWFLALDDIHDSGQGGGGGRRQPQRGQYSTSGTNFMSRDVRGGPRFTSSQLPRFSMPQNMSYLPQGYSPAPFYPQEGYYNQQNEQQQPTMSAYGGQDSGGYGGHYGQEAFYYSQHQQVSESYEGSEGGAYEEVKFEPSTAAASRASRSYVGIPSTTAPDVTTAYYAAASLSVMQQQRPPQPHGNRMYGNYRGGGADASEMRYTGGQPSPYQQQHYAPQPPPFHRQQPMRAPQYVPSPQQLRGPQPPPPPPRPSSDA